MGLFGKSNEDHAKDLIAMKRRLTDFAPFVDALKLDATASQFAKSIELRVHIYFVHWVIFLANHSPVTHEKRKFILDRLVMSLFESGDAFVKFGLLTVDDDERNLVGNGLRNSSFNPGPETLVQLGAWSEGYFYGTIERNHGDFSALLPYITENAFWEIENPVFGLLSTRSVLAPLRITSKEIAGLIKLVHRSLLLAGGDATRKVFN